FSVLSCEECASYRVVSATTRGKANSSGRKMAHPARGELRAGCRSSYLPSGIGITIGGTSFFFLSSLAFGLGGAGEGGASGGIRSGGVPVDLSSSFGLDGAGLELSPGTTSGGVEPDLASSMGFGRGSGSGLALSKLIGMSALFGERTGGFALESSFGARIGSG